MEKKDSPFFARFLEAQERTEEKFPAVKTDVKAGKFGTQKYPTDVDEPQTMKYPSDGDDNPPSI